jgi:hypothetical protein
MMHSAKILSIISLITFLFAVSSLNFCPTGAQAQPAERPLTNDDIISLARAGLSDAAIVATIQKSPTQFDLGPEALIYLKKSGVSNTVIETMVGGGGPLPEESASVPPPVEEGPPPSSEVPEPPPVAPPPPPPIRVFEPELVILPGTYVYFAPGIVGADIFFYNGFWYRSYRGYWYRSLAYNGVWIYITPPRIFFTLPLDYRVRAREFPHIRYHEFYRNWRGWQRDKYWEHHEQWRRHQNWYREHRRHVGPLPGPPKPGPLGPGPGKPGPLGPGLGKPGPLGPGLGKPGPLGPGPGKPGPLGPGLGKPGPLGPGPGKLAPSKVAPQGGVPAPSPKGEERR